MIEVKAAVKSDANDMLKVLKHNLVSLNENSDQSLGKKGFVLGVFSKEEIEKDIDDEKKIILVAKDESRIHAYLTAHHLEELSQKELSPLKEISALKTYKKILYYKQIAKNSDEKNLGTRLVKSMIETAKARGYDAIVCKIVHKPVRNEASISFHTKNNFRLVEEIRDEERKILLGVYLYHLETMA